MKEFRCNSVDKLPNTNMSFELCGHSPIKMSSNRRLADEDLVSINFVKEMITGLFVGSHRVFRAINGQRKLSKHIAVLWSFFLNHPKPSNPCDWWRSKKNLLIKLSAGRYSWMCRKKECFDQTFCWKIFSGGQHWHQASNCVTFHQLPTRKWKIGTLPAKWQIVRTIIQTVSRKKKEFMNIM